MKIPFGKYTLSLEIGTIGLRVGSKTPNHEWYGDLFLSWPPRRLRRFINDRVMRRWETLTRQGWQVDKIEILQPDNAARVFRRTMKPYTMLHYEHERCDVLAMSYPCPNEDGSVTIMARLNPDDASTLQELRCERLRPISFQPTGIPAENPI